MANDSLSSVYKEFLFGGMEPSSLFFSKTYPSFLTLKEGSTSLLGLLPLREEEENRPPVLGTASL